MRVRIKRTTNIIQIPSNFATLEQITQDGEFIYSVRYRIDPAKAIKAKSLKVKISAAEHPDVKQASNTFPNFDSELLVKNILFRSVIAKEKARKKGSKRFFSFISDITKRIPNSSTTKLITSTFDDPHIISMVRKIQPATFTELDGKNLNLPILDQNFNKNTDTDKTISSSDIKTASTKLIYNYKIDPANFSGNKTNSIRSAVHASDGTIHKKNTIDVEKNSSGKLLVASFLNNKKYSNQSQVGVGAHINVLAKEESTWIEIVEKLYIPIGDLPFDEFYFIFELLDTSNIKMQTLSRSVAHSKNVRTLQIPVIAPNISAVPISKLGKIVLNVKQNDKNATSIQIYRKVFRKGTPNVDAKYDLVGSVNTEVGDGFKKLEDVFVSTNPVIYRAIPVNSNGIKGSEFSSVVVKQKFNTAGKTRKVHNFPYFVSLDAKIKDSSIVVFVRDVPSGVIAIKLKKKDRTIKQKSFSSVGKIALFEGETSGFVVFEDPDVKKNRIYEYAVILVFPNGSEETSANNLLLEFNPPVANILNLSLGNPEVKKSGDNIDVTFTISKDIIQKDNDLIKTFLFEQGVATQFQDQILSNREKLQDLFAVNITRTNLSTGEIEDFGIVNSTNFSDKKFGSVKSVSPVQPGFKYSYTATAFARDIETLFDTLNRTVSVTQNISYILNPSKWRHPLIFSDGTISTERTRKKNHSKTIFSFGSVVDIKSTTVSLTDIVPTINEGKASLFSGNKIIVQWKVQGNVNKIDHFIIILDTLGIRTVVGKSHNITHSNYFQFIDELSNKECGEITYFIVPIYFDYSRGPELQTNSVIV